MLRYYCRHTRVLGFTIALGNLLAKWCPGVLWINHTTHIYITISETTFIAWKRKVWKWITGNKAGLTHAQFNLSVDHRPHSPDDHRIELSICVFFNCVSMATPIVAIVTLKPVRLTMKDILCSSCKNAYIVMYVDVAIAYIPNWRVEYPHTSLLLNCMCALS